ncbi:MAG: hypothetical protein ACR2O0_07375 [Rhizobiaceae bacterium]
MANKKDALIVIVLAVIVTFLDRAFISGPYLGWIGTVLSIVAGMGGGFLAGLAASSIGTRTGSADEAVISNGPWPVIFTISSALIFAAIAYFKLFDLTKVDYTTTDIIIHLLMVLLAVLTVRMAGLAVKNLT